jgi:hypothetical protein
MHGILKCSDNTWIREFLLTISPAAEKSASRSVAVEIVRRERRWTPAGATPARKLVSSTRQHYATVAIIELARGGATIPKCRRWLEEGVALHADAEPEMGPVIVKHPLTLRFVNTAILGYHHTQMR